MDANQAIASMFETRRTVSFTSSGSAPFLNAEAPVEPAASIHPAAATITPSVERNVTFSHRRATATGTYATESIQDDTGPTAASGDFFTNFLAASAARWSRTAMIAMSGASESVSSNFGSLYDHVASTSQATATNATA